MGDQPAAAADGRLAAGAPPGVIQDPELQNELSAAAFLLAANRVHQAGEAAGRCRSLLAKAAPDRFWD